MGNTVGSRGTVLLRAKNRQLLRVSREQWDILLGCVLGDGYVTKRGKIQIEHGAGQRDYVLWKYRKLNAVSYGMPSRVVRKDKRNGKSYVSYRFWTRQFFREWRKRFYPNGKKIFPIDLLEISPLSLAVWFMDDGYLVDNRRLMFSTDGFDKGSRERICRLFQSHFGVKTTVMGSGKLLIGTRQTRKIMPLIKQYIIPSMLYKIPRPRND